MVLARHIGALWGVAGFIALISYAVVRLFGVFLNSLDYSWHPAQWATLIVVAAFMAYSEGYKGFQLSYSPRLAARARYLAQSGSALELLLAPLFCMSFFRAPKKRIIVSFSLLIMIILLVTAFRFIPQPWRGILDAGVVVGLTWGMASTLYYCVRTFWGDRETAIDEPELS